MAPSRISGFARRLFADRRAVVALSAAGLSATCLVSVFADGSRAVGSAMFVPWVALLAFEFGVAGGTLAALVAFVLFLVAFLDQGASVTLVFVIFRLASFVLIGVGVGVLGARLRASERESRTLVEGLPLAVYVESQERGLIYVGPQIESMIGYSPSDWLTEESLWLRILHPEDREPVIAAYAAAVAADAPFVYEYRLLGPDDRVIWVRDRSTFVDDPEHSYRQGFIVDISEQKLAEKQVARDAVLMRGLIDATVDGISLTDREGRILIANEPMRRLVSGLGTPNEGPIHERLLVIAERMTDPERYARRMRELAADPVTPSVDEFAFAGGERVFQGFTAPVLGDEGEYLGRVWTLRDVSEQHELDRLREAFVATVSHELRTPLTSIVGFLELIESGPDDLSPETTSHIGIVRRNATRLQEMVDELLFVAQLDAERLSLELAETDLSELVQQSINAARPAADAKQLTLTLEHKTSGLIIADATRISQVLDNLISNAIKFTPAGGTVEVAIEDRDTSCALRITDTGLGIPDSEQPRLFERFFRSTTATADKIPGTGLGLTIAKAIIESHHGSITFASTEGAGTTFTITLPKQLALRAETRQHEPLQATPA